jgi:ABC-type glycerol-3-phosphate transport system substrate-binding protein
MKKIFKPVVGLLLCTVMILTLFGCNDQKYRDLNLQTIKPGDEITVEGNVKFTCNISTLVEESAANAVLDAFQDAYPNTSVTRDYNPGNIPARIASGEIGDVFWFTGPETYNYAVTQKCLLSLNQFIG